MSGGYFDHNEWHIDGIAEQIEELVASNNDDSLDEWGHTRGRFYTDETIKKFEEAAKLLRKAARMVHRIDYLVKDDDCEESFHRRWDEEVYARAWAGHPGRDNLSESVTGEDICERIADLENRYVPTKCSDQLPPVDGNGLWSGILFIDGDIRPMAFYDEVEGLGYWGGPYSDVLVIVDPSEYDSASWCDYPKIQYED